MSDRTHEQRLARRYLIASGAVSLMAIALTVLSRRAATHEVPRHGMNIDSGAWEQLIALALAPSALTFLSAGISLWRQGPARGLLHGLGVVAASFLIIMIGALGIAIVAAP